MKFFHVKNKSFVIPVNNSDTISYKSQYTYFRLQIILITELCLRDKKKKQQQLNFLYATADCQFIQILTQE
jgi:hypothetical protein